MIQGEDSISPLRKALVESTPPLCGKISEGLHEYKTQLLDENIVVTCCHCMSLYVTGKLSFPGFGRHVETALVKTHFTMVSSVVHSCIQIDLETAALG